MNSLREIQTSTLYKFDKKVVAYISIKQFLLNLFKEEDIFRYKIKLKVGKINSVLFKTCKLAICVDMYIRK